MSKTDELPAGPFFDAIREWNALVDERRKQHPGVPEGHMLVSPSVMKVWREEVAKFKAL